jgi:integral membrane protein (TIGR00529 family)
MTRTIDALKALLPNRRVLMGGLPAFIGLLPMPGGALFSAPMVDSVDPEHALNSSHKAGINYWFRHIWEYWLPLYPGVMLALLYSGLTIGTYILIMIPFTLLALGAGYLFLLRTIPLQATPANAGAKPGVGAIAGGLGPMAFCITVGVVGALFFALVNVPQKTANGYAILAGLILSSLWVGIQNRATLPTALRTFFSKRTVALLLLIVGIEMFSAALMLPVRGHALVALVRGELGSLGIPPLGIIMLVPLFAGLMTGVAAGYVGASFPIVFAILGDHPAHNTLIAATALSYTFGYIGMLLSPVHVCLIVTNRYFNSRLFHTYPYLLKPVIVMLVGSLSISGIYYLFL